MLWSFLYEVKSVITSAKEIEGNDESDDVSVTKWYSLDGSEKMLVIRGSDWRNESAASSLKTKQNDELQKRI